MNSFLVEPLMSEDLDFFSLLLFSYNLSPLPLWLLLPSEICPTRYCVSIAPSSLNVPSFIEVCFSCIRGIPNKFSSHKIFLRERMIPPFPSGKVLLLTFFSPPPVHIEDVKRQCPLVILKLRSSTEQVSFSPIPPFLSHQSPFPPTQST